MPNITCKIMSALCLAYGIVEFVTTKSTNGTAMTMFALSVLLSRA